MFPSSRDLRAAAPSALLNSARKTYLPKPHDDAMFITVIATIIRISSPVIDVNFSQPTHEKLKERKKELEERNTVGPSIRRPPSGYRQVAA